MNETIVQGTRQVAPLSLIAGAMLHTILIVDDDLATLELYERELGREYRVLTCTDELQASEVLATEEVSAIVLEPVALGEQGWAKLAAITHRPTKTPVPVLVCSTQDQRRRGQEMGATACLVKPVLPTTLLDALRKIALPT
jgi:DNA-binding response OmpR family regulator